MDKSLQLILTMQIIEILNLNCKTVEEAEELVKRVNEFIAFRWTN